MSVSLAIARCCGKANGVYFSWQICTNELFLLKHCQLPPSKKDGLHGQITLLDGVCRYLAAQSLGTITMWDFCQHINGVIAAGLGLTGQLATISERTARNWLQILRYSCVEVRKGLYHDGHELPNVVASQQKFLEKMAEYKK